MAAVTIADVVFVLEQLQVNVDAQLLRRIEWSLEGGNYTWSEDRLNELLSDFALRRSRFFQPFASERSLEDFLCENGISYEHYRQFIRSFQQASHVPSLLNALALDQLDCDSTTIVFAQRSPAPDTIVQKLKELGLSHTQCRLILGLSAKSYERLKRRMQDQRKEEISRRGRSEEDAWSFAKHAISEMCVRLLKEQKRSLLLVLETHQGIGDATFLYRKYGHVLGFDNSAEAHSIVLERAKLAGVYRHARDLYLRRVTSSDFPLLLAAEPYVFLAEEATPSEQGLPLLINQGLRFDAIDVDPWATSQPFFEDILKILAQPSLVMLTLGDQHPWPRGETAAWERFGVEGYTALLSEETKQVWRKTWMFQRLASAWYLRIAATRSVCLIPIVVMRNFEPWAMRSDFPHGAVGVDRVYFLGQPLFDPDKVEQVLHALTEPLPFFSEQMMLRMSVHAPTSPDQALSFVSFSDDIWPVMRPWWTVYHEWLLATKEPLSSRWNAVEPSDIREARQHLHQAIEQACLSKVMTGFSLAENWLKTLL